jgi:hypothetical protein
MTLEEVQAKLGIQLEQHSEISYSTVAPGWANMFGYDSAAVYSCVLKDGSLFYFSFIRFINSDNFVLTGKSHTPIDLMNSESSN